MTSQVNEKGSDNVHLLYTFRILRELWSMKFKSKWTLKHEIVNEVIEANWGNLGNEGKMG